MRSRTVPTRSPDPIRSTDPGSSSWRAGCWKWRPTRHARIGVVSTRLDGTRGDLAAVIVTVFVGVDLLKGEDGVGEEGGWAKKLKGSGAWWLSGGAERTWVNDLMAGRRQLDCCEPREFERSVAKMDRC